MARDWEAQFGAWAQPPGKTEQSRCANAESAVRNAIGASATFGSRDIAVFTHGSYANRVNVRQDSDVDIGVLCRDTSVPDYPDEYDKSAYGHVDATYHYSDLRGDLQETLVSYFGDGAVRQGNKAFDLHETSYHVDADVVPFFEHRRYSSPGHYLEGVALLPRNGWAWITNWPTQHYDNGVDKNTAARRRYKGLVRILKSLRNEMQDSGIDSAGGVAGFDVECLVWNVPNRAFEYESWDSRVQAALAHLWNDLRQPAACTDWGEVSELKYLCRPESKRKRLFAYVDGCWDYVGVRD